MEEFLEVLQALTEVYNEARGHKVITFGFECLRKRLFTFSHDYGYRYGCS